jgi:hypothetical protein
VAYDDESDTESKRNEGSPLKRKQKMTHVRTFFAPDALAVSLFVGIRFLFG